MMATPHESAVDLRLAATYVPACLCLVESLMTAALVSLAQQSGAVPVYVPIFALLVVDRMLSRADPVMERSDLVWVVFFSMAVNHERSTLVESTRPGVVFAEKVVMAAWAVASTLALTWMRPRRGAPLHGTLATALAFTSAVAFVRHSPEQLSRAPLVALRVVAFVGLSLCWVYLLGIHRRLLACARDTGAHCFAYFAPVLFIDLGLAAMFTACAAAGIAHMACASGEQEKARQEEKEEKGTPQQMMVKEPTQQAPPPMQMMAEPPQPPQDPFTFPAEKLSAYIKNFTPAQQHAPRESTSLA